MNSGTQNIPELERLYKQYYSALMLYAATIVKNNDNAADIVQQSFISLWKKMDSTDIHTSARSYLYKSVYNACLDFLKHEKVARRYHQETSKNNSEVRQQHSRELLDLEERIDIAIRQLPEQCGKIFQMSRVHGRKYREIAFDLNISEKTVENQMGKALKILRIALKDYLIWLMPLIKLLYDRR